GRRLRIPLKQEKLNDQLAQFSFDNTQIVNLEMETSAILALSKMMGHEATSICLGIANRPSGTFLSDYSKQMDELILYVLENF
ncbi:MAG: phosphorylase, partial [Crocinitomicaceae bacterium]